MPDIFTYVGISAPNITAVTSKSGPFYTTFDESPAQAPLADIRNAVVGAADVLIEGSEFFPGAIVMIGGLAALSVVVVDDETITCKAPGGSIDFADLTVDVKVTNTDGGTDTLPNSYTYILSAPTIASLTPAVGSSRGFRPVTIAGTDFYDNPAVYFRDLMATSIVRVSDTEITCFTPSIGEGIEVEVRVVNVDEQYALSLYTYAYPAPDLEIIGAGPVRRQGSEIAINDELNDAPNSCTMTVGGNDSTPVTIEPAAGQDVEVWIDEVLMFAGTIVACRKVTNEGDQQWHLQLTDWVWELNRRRPFETYIGMSATAIINDLITTYATGFTTVNVEALMPNVTIFFDGSMDLAACITAVMQSPGVEGWWYPDYEKDIHARRTAEVTDVPDDVDDSNLDLLRDQPVQIHVDITQMRTRVFVRWQDTTGASFVTQRDSATGQALLIAMQGGGDGVREDTIDSDVTDAGAAQVAGDDWLAKWDKPSVSIDYSTRDIKHRTGKTVTWNLSDPEVVGDFLIQSMHMDQIHVADGLLPRLNCHASMVQSPVTKFDFIDLLRRVMLSDPGQGSVVSSGGGGSTAYAAGSGLSVSGGNTYDVNVGDGLEIASDAVRVKLDGATLTRGAAGLKVSDSFAPAHYYEPLTNGDPVTPEIVFDSDGDVVMVYV